MREQPYAGGDAPALDDSQLSPREREVLEAALEGLSARAIASRLSLTEATVRSHLSAIYSKLGVGGRVELLARQSGRGASTTAIPEPTTSAPGKPEAAPRSDSTAPRPSSRTIRDRRVAVALAALLLCGLVLAAIALITQASLPRESDLATVSRLLASGQVAQLDLVNSTLTVTEKNGDRLRVEGGTPDAFEPILTAALNASVPVTVSKEEATPLSTQALMIAVPLLEVALLLALVVLLLRMIRRPPRLRPTG